MYTVHHTDKEVVPPCSGTVDFTVERIRPVRD